MARFRCIGCGEVVQSNFKPSDWSTVLVELDDVGSRTTAKIRALNFCAGCEGTARRFAEDLCAREEVAPAAAETLDERPPIRMPAPIPIAR